MTTLVVGRTRYGVGAGTGPMAAPMNAASLGFHVDDENAIIGDVVPRSPADLTGASPGSHTERYLNQCGRRKQRICSATSPTCG